MSYTTEDIVVPKSVPNSIEQNQFDLPVKTFMGYDPKGTTTVTGSPIVRPDPKPDAAQPATVEETVETPPAESVRLSPQVSAIARKEAAQRRERLAFEQEKKAFATKLADAEKFAQLKAKIAAKDYSAVEELGVEYNALTDYKLNKLAGEKPEEARYRKLEEEFAALKKAQEESSNKEYQSNQNLWKEEISKVTQNVEAYPEINFIGAGARAAVLQHINDSFEQDNVELTAEQAAKEIEKFLADRAIRMADSPTVNKKFQEKGKVLGHPKTSPNTITQNMTVTSQKPSSKPFHLLSESEQLAEAIRRVQAEKLARR